MRKFIENAFLCLVYALLFFPLASIAVYSFNDSKYSLSWKGFTFKWYASLTSNGELLQSALNSLNIAALSATLSCALGMMAAYILFRYRFRARRLLQGILFVMMMSPDIVIGISLLVMFLGISLPLGYWSLLLAHVTLCMPFAAATLYSRFKDFDDSILEAARDLGATEADAMRHIILPITAPAVLAAWLLCFTISLDDVLISFFTTGPTFEVLPLRIYSMVRLGVKPDVNALSVLMITLTVAAVLVSWRLMKEKK